MAQASHEYLSPSPPTRVRYGVLGFVASLSMITYLDRVCFSSGQSKFIEDLGLKSEADLGWVFAAFTIAYSIFEVPSGWLGDVFGPKKVLIRIVLWWSAFTALTGLIGLSTANGRIGAFQVGSLVVTPLAVLIVVRFLFGMGEAGAYPNITRTLHNWFPFRERGFAQGTVWMSARLMGGLTPMIWMLVVEGVRVPEWLSAGGQAWTLPPLLPHWRVAFWLFGVIGVAWCLLFALWFRDRPEQKPSVNAAELALIRESAAESQAGHAKIPWLKILRSKNLWILCLMYACQAYGWYFYITYLPRFLQEQYGVERTSFLGAIYKGGPLWMGAIGCLAGGFLTDWFIRRTGNRRWGRRIFGAIGHACCGLCFLLCPWAPTAFWFFLAISMAGFSADLTMGSSWALCQDIGRRHAAIVAGFMNMIGNAGGAVANVVTAFILTAAQKAHAAGLHLPVEHLSDAQKTAGLLNGYHVNFYMFAAVHVIGVLCWLNVDSTRPVAPDEDDRDVPSPAGQAGPAGQS